MPADVTSLSDSLDNKRRRCYRDPEVTRNNARVLGWLTAPGSLTSRRVGVARPANGRIHVELFFFFFFFFWVRSPAISLGFTTLGEIFAYVTVFFNPTIKVVTFRLRGWCVLGAFLLLAITRLGHERQDLWSPCDEMHVCTD